MEAFAAETDKIKHTRAPRAALKLRFPEHSISPMLTRSGFPSSLEFPVDWAVDQYFNALGHRSGKMMYYGAASHFSQPLSIEALKSSSSAGRSFSINPKGLGRFKSFVFSLTSRCIRYNRRQFETESDLFSPLPANPYILFDLVVRIRHAFIGVSHPELLKPLRTFCAVSKMWVPGTSELVIDRRARSSGHVCAPELFHGREKVPAKNAE